MQLDPIFHQKKETVIVGLCFMERKIKAKRNQQIYARLNCEQIQTVQLWPYFDKHWTTWPVVDVLLQSHTGSFPYIMVWEYVQKHKPFLINDIETQQLLWDRTVIYNALNEINVPVPKYYPMYLHQNHVDSIQEKCFGKILTENGQNVSYQDYTKNQANIPNLFRKQYQVSREKFIGNQITEIPQGLLIKSNEKMVKIQKPFVQKPSNSHDHKISLYYQKILGGGRRLLFRQNHGHVSSAESQYQKNKHNIRKDQNYIYEEFIATNVFDIKVYTIGDFVFAQSRRSPMVYAQKDLKNSEMRNEIELTSQEREYCRRIVKKFKFPVCGFDILRSEGKSYVCDINGWVFAKGGGSSEQVIYYWDLVAKLLKNMIFEKFFPQKAQKLEFKFFKEYKQLFCPKIKSFTEPEKQQELRCVFQMIPVKREQCEAKLGEIHENLILMGEQIRKNSYDDINSLRLYSTFQHELRVECSQKDNEKIQAGYLLKGYLGIEGELSPLEVSVLKVNQNGQISSNELDKFSYALLNILKNLAQIENQEKEQRPIRLRTLVSFCKNQALQKISKLFKTTNQNDCCSKCQKDQNQDVKTQLKIPLSRIEFKMYEKDLKKCQERISNLDLSRFRVKIHEFYDNRNIILLDASLQEFKRLCKSYLSNIKI